MLVFACLATVTVSRHEMWRDEMHAWQAVVDSSSPAELARAVRPEGHAGLWFAMLYPLSRFTANPVAMQILHLMIAVATAAVVLVLAPVPLGWRALVVFGYFPAYEYCAISRNYAIGALLLLLFCALYPGRARRPLLLASLLFLLAQASVYTMILSCALGVMWIADERTAARPLQHLGSRKIAAVSVWLAGLVLSFLQLLGARSIMVAPDAAKLLGGSRVLSVLATPWRGYVPLPTFRFHFWNSNLLDGVPAGDALQAVLAITLVILLAAMLAGRRPVQLLFVIGTAGLLAFTALFYVGDLRHHGHHLLLLVACLWLWHAGKGARTHAQRWPAVALITGLLVANLVAGIYAVSRDWRDPFSEGRAVAEAIRSLRPANLPVVGHRDVQVATVTGYLQRPVYYPSRGQEAYFIPWTVPSRGGIDDAEVFRQARIMAERRGEDVLIVLSRSGRRRPDSIGPATKIACFFKSIVGSEQYELYRMPGLAAAAEGGP